MTSTPQPLAGLRVVEFTHMVMGPTCGMILADMGAEVIKVEPIDGEGTRRLLGAGAGFFPMFNRNKKSMAADLHKPEGAAIARRVAASADVVVENFKPGTMVKYGLDYASLAPANPRLIYVSNKGFLPGPYENRTALDEVVQMMGGLAYMTGLPDRPLRVGSSVNDIMGGMFGAIAILAALRERDATGHGKHVKSALFENTVYLVAQHMAQQAITGEAPPPMSVKRPAWGIYDIFDTRDADRLFVGVVTDTQWAVFCREFGEPELGADARLATNALRVKERGWLVPRLNEIFKRHDKASLEAKLEAIGLPFAPIAKPWDLFDDPHLNAAGGLVETRVAPGTSVKVPSLPREFDGQRLPKRSDPPLLGEGARGLLEGLGLAAAEIDALARDGIVGLAA